MGSKKQRPGNVPVLPGGGGAVAIDTGRIVVNCRLSGTAVASPTTGTLSGMGRLALRGTTVVLVGSAGDLAVLADEDLLVKELRDCLRRKFRYEGRLETIGADSVVHVRPAS